MDYYFTASRITGNGNTVFPDEIIIEDGNLQTSKLT